MKRPQPYIFQKCVRWLALILTYGILWKKIPSLTTRGQAQGVTWHTVFNKGHLSLPFFFSWLLLFELEPHATQSGLKFPMSLRIDPEILVLLPPLPTQLDSRCTLQHLAYVVLGWRPGLGAWEASTLLTEPQPSPIFLSLGVSQTLNSTTPWGLCWTLPYTFLKGPPYTFLRVHPLWDATLELWGTSASRKGAQD